MPSRAVLFFGAASAALSTITAGAALEGCGGDDTAVPPAADAASDRSVATDAPSQDSASGSDGATADADGGPTTKAVAIEFKAVVGAQPFSCTATYDGLGVAATSVKPVDFRFYVHDVRLVRAGSTAVSLTLEQDGKWQYQGVALLDFEDKTGRCEGNPDLNDTVRGTVPAGSYVGLAFKLGVPFALNHANQAVAPPPLSLTQLFWSWQSGYKFAKIDSHPQGTMADGGALPTWAIHVGSTDCNADPADGGTVTKCDRPDRAEIAFAAFDPATQAVVVDYKALVADTDLTNNPPPIPGCTSQTTSLGPQCVHIFPHLGIDLVTGAPVAGQSVFSVK